MRRRRSGSRSKRSRSLNRIWNRSSRSRNSWCCCSCRRHCPYCWHWCCRWRCARLHRCPCFRCGRGNARRGRCLARLRCACCDLCYWSYCFLLCLAWRCCVLHSMSSEASVDGGGVRRHRGLYMIIVLVMCWEIYLCFVRGSCVIFYSSWLKFYRRSATSPGLMFGLTPSHLGSTVCLATVKFWLDI